MAEDKSRVRAWTFIVWEDSCIDNWIQYLKDLHVPGAISPIHDKDKKIEDGVEVFKKAHWHVVIVFSGVKSYEQVKEITDHINAEFPVRINDIGGMIRYFTHIDDPEKAQYDRALIVPLAGLDVSIYYELPKSKIREYMIEIGRWIIANKIYEFADFLEYSINNNLEWYYIGTQVSTNSIMGFIQSRRHRDKKNFVSVDQDGVVC